MTTPEELLELIEPYLDDLALTPELGELERSMRYALAGGGKRIRPLLCLATAEAAGAEPEAALPAAAALELVHNFSLVHDDLPSLDNDELRRGRPSTWARVGEGIAGFSVSLTVSATSFPPTCSLFAWDDWRPPRRSRDTGPNR